MLPFWRLPFARQEPDGHFGRAGGDCEGGGTGVDPTFDAGMTGEVCFTGPPMALRFIGPPIEPCARAGALPQRPRMTSTSTALFIGPSFHSVQEPGRQDCTSL